MTFAQTMFALAPFLVGAPLFAIGNYFFGGIHEH
jgi:hypothetical protein